MSLFEFFAWFGCGVEIGGDGGVDDVIVVHISLLEFGGGVVGGWFRFPSFGLYTENSHNLTG